MRSLRSTPASPVDAANYGVPCRGPRWPLRAECLVIIFLPMATFSSPPALSGNPTVSELANESGTSQSTNVLNPAPGDPSVGNIQTLEPYDLPRSYGRGGGRNRGGRGRGNYKRQIIEYPPLQGIKKSFKKFFVMKSSNPEIENLWSHLDTIKANRELERILKGAPKRITELNNGTILIEAQNEQQSEKIKQIKKICQIEVNIAEHQTLNYTKGTIRSKRFVEEEESKLLEELSRYNVTEIYKIKRKKDETQENTGVMILTFEGCEIPEEIKIGWTSLEVRKYFPNPRQCYKCQRFNHSSKACRSPEDVCNRCGTWGHSGRGCENPHNCANCGEAHPANDRRCFFFTLEKEIIAVQTNEKLGYREAKKKVLKNQIEPNMTYASKLKEKLDNRPRRDRSPREPNNTVEANPIEPNLNANMIEPTNLQETPQQINSDILSKKRGKSDSETDQPNKKANTLQRMEDEPIVRSTARNSSQASLPPKVEGKPSAPPSSQPLGNNQSSRGGSPLEHAKMTQSSSQKRGKTNPTHSSYTFTSNSQNSTVFFKDKNVPHSNASKEINKYIVPLSIVAYSSLPFKNIYKKKIILLLKSS